jgi:hypothetical protein
MVMRAREVEELNARAVNAPRTSRPATGAAEAILRLQRSAGNHAVQRALLQRHLRFGSEEVSVAEAAKRVTDRLTIVSAGTQIGCSDYLLRSILSAAQGLSFAVDEAAVVQAYLAAASEIGRFLDRRAALKKDVETIFSSQDNQGRLGMILWATSQPWFAAGRFFAIVRGMTVEQAVNVVKHGTFGGDPAATAARQPPTEEMASKQTGEMQKDTGAGNLEEWSLTAQSGFATEGVIMVAVTRAGEARFPPQEKMTKDLSGDAQNPRSTSPTQPIPYGGFFGKPPAEYAGLHVIGEVGVTGWRDQPFARLRDLPPQALPPTVPPEALGTALCAIQGIGRAMEGLKPADAINGYIAHKQTAGLAALFPAPAAGPSTPELVKH